MPDDVYVKEEYVEFITSFFEKEGGDFLLYNKIPLLPKYDEEYEKCVVQAIHSYIEAHKLATGYYYENINSEGRENMLAIAISAFLLLREI